MSVLTKKNYGRSKGTGMSSEEKKLVDDDLEKIIEVLGDEQDLVDQLMEAYKEWNLKLKCLVEASEQQLKESGEDKLSVEDTEDLVRIKAEAEEEFYEKEKNILIQAILRKQDQLENKKMLEKELEAKCERIKKAQTRLQVGHKVYPNDPCPCGSGKKYKKCCGK